MIVLTDEDDQSHANDCYIGQSISYGEYKTTTSGSITPGYYSIGVSRVYANYSYDKSITYPAVYKDGILVTAAQTVKTTSTGSVFMTDILAANISTCVDQAKTNSTIVNAQGYNITCEIRNGTVKVSGTQADDLCTKGTDTSGKTFLAIDKNYNGQCTYVSEKNNTTTVSTRSVTATSSIPVLSASLPDGDFDSQTIQKMKAVLSKFFVSVIHQNGQCTLKTAQSVGTRWEALAKLFSEEITTSPICASSYSTALGGSHSLQIKWHLKLTT